MHVDRHVCGSCRTILPYIASELGNPEIAVKEFIETDGQLPKCIEWVANSAARDFP